MSANTAHLVAISISERRGIPKHNVPQARLVSEWGIDGDAHAGAWHRQVSLLAEESIDRMRELGADVRAGAFAENLTTRGIDLPALAVGARIQVGEAELEITQIGKECHDRCEIYKRVGDCVMPREGIFARVVRGGEIHAGDAIEVRKDALPKSSP
jgi:molybdopterin adenylyltransferase